MEKIKLLSLETPLVHRDEPSGLFIGTSKRLLALMNSAPAELLHLLTYAALQPSLNQTFCLHVPQRFPLAYRYHADKTAVLAQKKR
jgi:hypothetical protein